MENLIHKTIESKSLPDVEKRLIEFIASTESMDRDGEVIKSTAWDLKNYLKNPVVQWAHDYSAPPIGKSPGIGVKGGVLNLPVEFPPEGDYEFADIIYRLAKKGFINAVSVGFIPKEYDRGTKEGGPSRTFTQVELLEVSIVPVPSNPDALVSARDAGVISTKEYKKLTVKEKKPTQEEIKDEFDYTLQIIKSGDLNEDNKTFLKTIELEIKRITGGDTPVENITTTTNIQAEPKNETLSATEIAQVIFDTYKEWRNTNA